MKVFSSQLIYSYKFILNNCVDNVLNQLFVGGHLVFSITTNNITMNLLETKSLNMFLLTSSRWMTKNQSLAKH